MTLERLLFCECFLPFSSRWDGKDITLAKRVATGKTPSHLWIDSKSSTIYSTMQDSDELIAVDLASQSIKWRTKTGSLPADVYGTADDRLLLIGLTGSDAVEVYDVSGKEPKRVKVIKTGAGAHAFRALGDQRHVLFGTVNFEQRYDPTGIRDQVEQSRDYGRGFWSQQWLGLKRLMGRA